MLKRVGFVRLFWNDFAALGKAFNGKAHTQYVKDTPAVMVYSSGTTGASKGIVLTNDGINATIAFYSKELFRYERGDTFLSILPLFLSTGIVFTILMPLCKGITVICEPEFTKENFVKQVLNHKPNYTLGTTSFDVHPLSLQEIFDEIYKTSNFEMEVEKLVIKKKLAAGMVVTYGTANYRDIYYIGNQQEISDDGEVDIQSIKRESIFDLSSVTKLFTCICVLQLVESKMIKLTDYIGMIDERFKNLKLTTVEDVLSFQVSLITAKRIDMADNLEEIEDLIFNIEPANVGVRAYTDMGAMVLKYVIEKVTGKSFFDVVDDRILTPCNMKNTFITVADDTRIVSNNYERRISAEEYILIDSIKKGVVNDAKARNINKYKKQLCGHAGLFSTADDMAGFAQAILNEKILSKELIEKIGINRTGKRKADGSFTQFHGYLCYSKNPIIDDSEVSHWLSGNAFALGGYTGNQITIDFRNQVFLFLASNRCHNRITFVDKSVNIRRTQGGGIERNDGNEYIVSSRFAYDRGDVIESAIKMALKYRYIEKKYPHENSSKNVSCDRSNNK